ncbi:unnamed protein product [Microthlaspi erraticum]|uniref:Uncharacterized protein n=1 Tax=Microthlaspi erraticum TaxID=1685480 RepID=A0A6D2JVD7_9BRAS|nr:unnamed protein product [Microthlaspi erraticum]
MISVRSSDLGLHVGSDLNPRGDSDGVLSDRDTNFGDDLRIGLWVLFSVLLRWFEEKIVEAYGSSGKESTRFMRSHSLGAIGNWDSKGVIKERRQLRSNKGQKGKWETESNLYEYFTGLRSESRWRYFVEETKEGFGQQGIIKDGKWETKSNPCEFFTGIRSESRWWLIAEENMEGWGQKGSRDIAMESHTWKFHDCIWVNYSLADFWNFSFKICGDSSDIIIIMNGDSVRFEGIVVIELRQYKKTVTIRLIQYCLFSVLLRIFFLSLILRVLILVFPVVLIISFCIGVVVQGLAMTQGKLVGNGASNQGDKKPVNRLKITVPRFDNTALIRGYSRTLIGRCMNPAAQDVNALLHHMPRFWKMEEWVAGADLGMGRFQFDFDNEEDIVEAIKFWVRMMGIPLHFWAEPTFRSIGEAIGEVIEVDIDGGRVHVCLDGYKPLVFETTVEFYGGEETCPVLRRAREERENQKRRDEKPDGGAMSYKGVVLNGPGGENGAVRQSHHNAAGDLKGKGKAVEQQEDRGKWQAGFRGNGKHGGETSGDQRKPAGFGSHDNRKRINRPMTIFRP